MKFKELVSKLNEKASMEEGKPETTKNYASATPGQGNVVFTPDTQYDGVAIAKELDPSGGIEKQMAKARTNLDIDADGDVDAMDKKNDNIPDEVTGAEKKNLTLDLLKKGAKERAHTKKGVAYESVMLEKLSASDDMGKWISDFQKSDAPQFAGKSAEERKKMAVAAKLQADRDGKLESVEEAVDAKKVVAYLVKKGNNPKAAESMVKKELAGAMKAYPNAPVAKIADYIRTVAEDIEEGTYHDSGWKKSTGQRKDSSGNVIKNFAKHLAKKGATENDPNRKLRSDEKKVNGQIKREEVEEDLEETRVLGRITSAEVHKVLGPTKNAAQGIAALKKAFKVDDAQAKAMMDKVMKESVEQIDESEDKTMGRLKQLVRFGLMDKAKLPLLARAMKSLDKGQVTNPTERATLFELLNELIGIVTGDDAMFAKVRMNVQKEEFDKE